MTCLVSGFDFLIFFNLNYTAIFSKCVTFPKKPNINNIPKKDKKIRALKGLGRFKDVEVLGT